MKVTQSDPVLWLQEENIILTVHGTARQLTTLNPRFSFSASSPSALLFPRSLRLAASAALIFQNPTVSLQEQFIVCARAEAFLCDPLHVFKQLYAKF